MDVKEALEKRRSYRVLEPFDITNELIKELGQAAQLAPSCFNNQPWQYIFIHNQDPLKEFQSALSEGNEWVHDASLLIIVVSEKELDCNMKDGREYYLFDTGISSGFIMLRATELGLVAHPIAGYDQQKAKELLDVPSEMTLITILAIGKHSDNYKEILPQDKIDEEENRPSRKSLSEFIFIDNYGNNLK